MASKANIKKLDKVFSMYIRKRDSKMFGGEAFRCISCNGIKPFDQSDCGHYYGRKIMNLRYDEKNCNAQCRHCNRFNEGFRQGYAQGLIRKYGQNILNELEVKSIQMRKWEDFEIKELINLYNEKAV